LPEQRVEPRERRDGVAHGDAVAPGGAVARLVEHPHHRVAVSALLVHVGRIQGKGEVMHLLGPEAYAFPTRADAQRCTTGSREPGAVPIALIIDSERGVSLGFFPARVPLDRYAGGADHLVLREVER